MDWDYPGKNTGVGCHFLSPGHLPDSRIEPTSPALQADSLPLSHIGSPIYWILLVIQSLSRVWLFCCCCSVAKSCLTVCDPVNSSTPGFPGLHSLLEFVQTQRPLNHWYHPTISSSVRPSPPTLNLSQHQGLFQWIGSSHQAAKILELHLQHQSYQWIFRIDIL